MYDRADSYEVERARQTEEEKTEAWRLHVLLQAGYPTDLAETIAVCTYVDLHEAEQLLRRGCSPKLAAEILL